jgi:hypothetical protein
MGGLLEAAAAFWHRVLPRQRAGKHLLKKRLMPLAPAG